MENLLVLIVIVLTIVLLWPFRRVTIFEYQRGLKYVKGKFFSVLQPGRYLTWKYATTVDTIDIRPRAVTVPGQEVLSSDGVTLKVSIAAQFEISDPSTAINKVESYQEALYQALQVALREIIGSSTIEELLEKRAEFAQELQEMSTIAVEPFGLRLISANIKDIMLPGDLKRIFAQEVKAKKEGMAALEKARGETAALRNLANAAKMVESNPALMQLRMLQVMTDGGGNTFVVGVPPGTPVIPSKSSEPGTVGENRASDLPE